MEMLRNKLFHNKTRNDGVVLQQRTRHGLFNRRDVHAKPYRIVVVFRLTDARAHGRSRLGIVCDIALK